MVTCTRHTQDQAGQNFNIGEAGALQASPFTVLFEGTAIGRCSMLHTHVCMGSINQVYWAIQKKKVRSGTLSWRGNGERCHNSLHILQNTQG